MTLNQQKYLRFIIPGMMLYGYLVIFCWTTEWCAVEIPTKLEEISKLIASVVLGFIYAVSGLREISNSYYHQRVNINIRDVLVEPFLRSNPELERITWNEIRPIFYHYIDNDKSLERQSEIIRWNGLLWTSTADLRACAFIGTLFFSIAIVCGYHFQGLAFEFGRAGYPITGLLIIFLLSFYWSSRLTEKHRRLGKEQCEYIILYKKEDLLEKLKKSLRHNNEGS